MNTTEQLARYGYGLTEDNVITTPAGNETGIRLSVKRGRVQARMTTGGLVWSGPADKIGSFLEGFWFAKPLTAPCDAVAEECQPLCLGVAAANDICTRCETRIDDEGCCCAKGPTRGDDICQEDSGSMTDCRPICDQPATHTVTHDGYKGPYTYRLCARHARSASARYYPYTVTVEEN